MLSHFTIDMTVKNKKHSIVLVEDEENLHEALKALEADQVVRDALGEGLTEEFLKLKHMEWVEYMRHVSDWEINRYVEFY